MIPKVNFPSQKSKWFLGFGILLSVFLVGALYWQGLKGPFLLDDFQTLQPAQMDTFSFEKLLEICTTNTSGPLGRPLSLLTFALNDLAFGHAPFSFKLINLALHLLTAFVMGLFVYLLLGFLKNSVSRKLSFSFCIAFLWLIHPLQISTVLYVVQRMTILSQLFVLTALIFYFLARSKQIANQKAWPLFCLSAVSGLLALAAKETAVLIPFYLFIAEYFILRFQGKNEQQHHRLQRFHQVFLLTYILTGLVLFWLKFDLYMGIFSEKLFSLVERLLTEINVLVLYLKLILLPKLSSMGLYQDDFPIAHGLDLTLLVNAILLSLLGVLIFIYRKRHPLISFGLAWFFVSHLLESTVLPLELVFEHRNYLASLGPLLILVTFFFYIVDSPKIKYKFIHFILGGAYLCILMSITWERAYIWSDTEHLLEASLEFHPNSARVHIEVANWFLDHEAYALAFAELEKAQQLQPDNNGILLHTLLIHCRARSIPEDLYGKILTTLQKTPITPYTLTALRQIVENIYHNQCQAMDQEKLITILQQAHQNPFLKYHPYYQSELYNLEAALKMLNKDPGNAILLLMKSFEAYPKNLKALVTKAMLEYQQGEIQKAEETLHLLTQYKQKLYAPKADIKALEKKLEQPFITQE